MRGISPVTCVKFVCPSKMTKKSLFFHSLPGSEASPYPLLLSHSSTPLSLSFYYSTQTCLPLRPTAAGCGNGCWTLPPPPTDERRALPPPSTDCGQMQQRLLGIVPSSDRRAPGDSSNRWALSSPGPLPLSLSDAPPTNGHRILRALLPSRPS